MHNPLDDLVAFVLWLQAKHKTSLDKLDEHG